MTPVINGIFVGITLSLMVGPALFMLLQTSLHRGFKYGVNIAIGILLSDALALSLVWFGVSKILGEDPRQNLWFSLIGGIVLILFGAYMFMKPTPSKSKKKTPDEPAEDDDKSINILATEPEMPKVSQELAKELFDDDKPSKWYVYLLKGFVMNIVNPGIWFIWITAMVTVSSTFHGNIRAIVSFFAATLLTVFCFDTLKAYIADRLKNLLSPRFVHKMNQFVGIILVIFGVYLIVNCFVDLQAMVNSLININV